MEKKMSNDLTLALLQNQKMVLAVLHTLIAVMAVNIAATLGILLVVYRKK